jgi:hypothetical protein
MAATRRPHDNGAKRAQRRTFRCPKVREVTGTSEPNKAQVLNKAVVRLGGCPPLKSYAPTGYTEMIHSHRRNDDLHHQLSGSYGDSIRRDIGS